ncbi:carbon-nitrogen hydrolase family protein [Anaerosphaera multitolerans]|uniref:Carbon-nitrogen hydrolase family protein n=1 Tax=Anaerosphaera multitolerans TaxID=2487351 RepID=A0A437S943_9FIRM|nr:carbon-nitrogen hydrolase family protein [Anaerosphaera multitolerans]RVU55629.1 carbon-nitrogen hydrolase family protein [Anaerosphaera multitolerans]
MKSLEDSCKVAVVQASPILFNKEATIDKTIELIEEAGSGGADLIIFPESYIPCYPRGFSYGYIVGSRTMEGREDWKVFYDNSLLVPSQDTDRIGEAVKKVGAYVGIGVSERDLHNTTLYCSFLIFSPDGQLVAKHRKMKPTGTERLIWGDGHSNSITTLDTEFGTMGTLICWENYMPLARAALYDRGVTLYLAPTADNRDEWQITMRHIALEGRCYVIGCNQYVNKSMYPNIFNYQDELNSLPEELCPGGSCIVDPFGQYVVEPLWNKEEIIYADLDMGQVILSRMDFDPAGHYSRPDILELIVHDK